MTQIGSSNNYMIEVTPARDDNLKSLNIIITESDGIDSSYYSFDLDVKNNPPYFIDSLGRT